MRGEGRGGHPLHALGSAWARSPCLCPPLPPPPPFSKEPCPPPNPPTPGCPSDKEPCACVPGGPLLRGRPREGQRGSAGRGGEGTVLCAGALCGGALSTPAQQEGQSMLGLADSGLGFNLA